MLRSCKLASIWLLTSLGFASFSRADLDGYVKAADPSFSWKEQRTRDWPEGKATYLSLTSQTWRGIAWTHELQIYEPHEIQSPDAMLFVIGGGRNDDGEAGSAAAERGFTLANACKARVAVIPQVPNQPLFGGKVEDDLIAETLVHAIAEPGSDWPLLFPMVKSAVRGMDAVQEWSKKAGRDVNKFVVTGSSKRGWTTWLTAAVDPRVAGIAPMVFPNLNLIQQSRHSIEVWGRPSEQVADYTRRGLTGFAKMPAINGVGRSIDPFTYIDRIKVPVLQICGTNDPYWTLDSADLYWNDIKGPKYLLYLPNAGHDLQVHREYAIKGIAAMFRHAAGGLKFPELQWSFDTSSPDSTGIAIKSSVEAKSCVIWATHSPTRDFRTVEWKDEAKMPPGKEFEHVLALDGGQFTTAVGDLTFEVDGFEFHLSTQIAPTRRKGPQ